MGCKELDATEHILFSFALILTLQFHKTVFFFLNLILCIVSSQFSCSAWNTCTKTHLVGSEKAQIFTAVGKMGFDFVSCLGS